MLLVERSQWGQNAVMASTRTEISAGIRLTGDLAGDGDVLILGRFEGQIHVGGELVVGRSGFARGDVVAARVRIDGRLEGRVRATQQVVIGSHGALIGDVQGMLAVEKGGVFRGQVQVEIDITASHTSGPIETVHPKPPAPFDSQPTPRRLVKAPAPPDPTPTPSVYTLRSDRSSTSSPGALSLTTENASTGPVARPILSVPVKERTATEPAAHRATGTVTDDRRSARRPKRLLTRRETAQESSPTAEMDRVSAVPPSLGGPLAPDVPVVRAGGHRSISAPHRRQPRPTLAKGAPPQVHRPALPTPRERPQKGDRVQEHVDLTDEWFVDEDEELRRR
jgi:cytoskeletal protein CcmA (bactofilin family)